MLLVLVLCVILGVSDTVALLTTRVAEIILHSEPSRARGLAELFVAYCAFTLICVAMLSILDFARRKD